LVGDSHSHSLAKARVDEAGLADQVEYKESTLEDLDEQDKHDPVYINFSMHEARGIDLATKNVRNALKPGGYFVISDFPVPDGHDGLRTVPAQVMNGIQYFEAQIDDQLVSTETFVKLLEDQGSNNVGSFIITPVHNVIFGTK